MAVYVPGEGATIDDVIEEHCHIKLSKKSRQRDLAMKFGYFERDLEMCSDEEEIGRKINGRPLECMCCIGPNNKLRIASKTATQPEKTIFYKTNEGEDI